VARPVLREIGMAAHLDGENGFTYRLLHQQQTDAERLHEGDITRPGATCGAACAISPAENVSSSSVGSASSRPGSGSGWRTGGRPHRIDPVLVAARRTSGMGEWDTGRVRSRVVTRSALGGPGVVSLPLRPHEWIAVSATPFACCRTPRRAVTAVVQGAAVTDAVRQAATGCASSVGPQHRHTLAASPHPSRRRHTPTVASQPGPRGRGVPECGHRSRFLSQWWPIG
jgi:hypothetical protein